MQTFARTRVRVPRAYEHVHVGESGGVHVPLDNPCQPRYGNIDDPIVPVKFSWIFDEEGHGVGHYDLLVEASSEPRDDDVPLEPWMFEDVLSCPGSSAGVRPQACPYVHVPTC